MSTTSVSTPSGQARRVTATGHVVGLSYFSLREGMRYTVEGVATIWELEPEGAVELLWENGSRTFTSQSRDLDPICDG